MQKEKLKILVDLQALQTGSAKRGIGRYSLSLINAIAKQHNDSIDIHILFNDGDNKPDSLIINDLKKLIDESKFFYFPVAPNLNFLNAEDPLFKSTILLREDLIHKINPDVVLTTSLFEIDALTFISPHSARSYLNVVILYDLIPLTDPDTYLGNKLLKSWYASKIECLQNADLIFSISEHSKEDAISKLNINPSIIKNISGASNLSKINPVKLPDSLLNLLNTKPFILYVGGFDKRKNVLKLIKAYATLPKEIKNTYSLVLAGKKSDIESMSLNKEIQKYELQPENIIMLDYVPDNELISLYSQCKLFVFPSENEGFGLPPLEAMEFGAPVIAANRASLIEVLKYKEMLFNPDDLVEFSNLITKSLEDNEFRKFLKTCANERSKYFSWEKTAGLAVTFLNENLLAKPNYIYNELSYSTIINKISDFCTNDSELESAAILISKHIEATGKIKIKYESSDVKA